MGMFPKRVPATSPPDFEGGDDICDVSGEGGNICVTRGGERARGGTTEQIFLAANFAPPKNFCALFASP